VDFQEAFGTFGVSSTETLDLSAIRLRRARRRTSIAVASAVLVATLGSAAFTPGLAHAGDPAAGERADLEETRDQRRQLDGELSDLEATDAQIESYLIALDEELAEAVAAVQAAERQAQWASGHSDLASARLATAERILGRAETWVRDGAVTAYVQPPDDILEANVLTDNAADATRRLALVTVVLSGRQRRVVELRAARGEVAAQNDVAADVASLADQALDDLAQAQQDLQAVRAEHERTRLEVQARIEEYRAAADALAAEERQLEDLIRSVQLDAIRRAGSAPDALFRPTGGYVSSEFGPRWGRSHNGIDFAAATGTAVAASAPGYVSHAGPYGSFGNLVMIEHGGGFTTLYAHMSIVNVGEGSRVDVGDKIGEVGSTGRSTGPHLHFEVRRHGEAVNPRNLLLL
jgi:murein DD-endopeptidase MepM/ murein hydrolase activator NlpD